MIAQEIFDKAVGALLTQNRKSEALVEGDRRNQCRYRGPDGLKCAVGHLIPDAVYSPDMDAEDKETDVTTILVKFPQIEPHVLPEDMARDIGFHFVQSLQAVHDDFTPDEWRDQYKRKAEQFDLQFNF